MRAKLLAVAAVLLVGGVSAIGGEDARVAADDQPRSDREARSDEGDTAAPRPRRERDHEPRLPRERDPAPRPRTWFVSRVIDGDTIELGNGAGVRIVGIDTPEVGECGYDAATSSMARLVLGKQVRLTVSDEDTDRYGRLLRYVDVGPVDAGLRQLEGGFAVARYDSRDGYGFHPREHAYIAADDAAKAFACPRPAPAPPPANPGGACAPGYQPCVPPFPPDVDCADVDGPVRVSGTDPHGLDADGDGVACE